MAKIIRLSIEGYRSIRERIEINFPEKTPVVLVGENNSGKSNIVRALQLVLGPFWPGNHDPEDHEFFGRRREQPIRIVVEFDPDEPLGQKFIRIIWEYDPSKEKPYFFGITTDGRENRVTNEIRDTCMCIVVEADRNLAYHLSYSSKWTFLSRLMRRFHRALENCGDVREELERLFGQVKENFYKVSEFKEFTENLQRELGDLIFAMQHQLQVDFEAYNPVNFFHALRLQAVENGSPRTLEEMGTGEQQILALALAYAYARAFHGGLILVVEEPEAHLHPLAQQWLARRLKSRCNEGLQILITTHSPAFISIEDLEGLVLVYKDNGATRVRQISRRELVEKCVELGVSRSRVTENNILPFYAANATNDLLSGFFAKAVVLVEGPTEALSLPYLLQKCTLDVEKEGIAVISVGGKGNLAKWYRLYKAYEIPCYIIFDNDIKNDKEKANLKDALSAVGIDSGNCEKLIQSSSWIVEASYTIFGKDFESTMRRYFKRYSELEEEARNLRIHSKQFIARYVAQRLKKDNDDPGWEYMNRMATYLRKLIH